MRTDCDPRTSDALLLVETPSIYMVNIHSPSSHLAIGRHISLSWRATFHLGKPFSSTGLVF